MDFASTVPVEERISPRGESRPAWTTSGFAWSRLSAAARWTCTNQAWARITPNRSTMTMVSPVIRLFMRSLPG